MDHVKFGKQLKHHVDPSTRPTDEELKSFAPDLKDLIKTKLSALNGRDYNLTRRNEARLRRIHTIIKDYRAANSTNDYSIEEWFCLEYAAAEYAEHFYISNWQGYWLAILDRLNPKKNKPRLTQTLDIEDAKQFPIEQLYPNQLRQFGGKLTGICPFHQEKTASFFIFDNNHWFCFGACCAGGDAIDFQMRLKGYDFKEAVRSLT